MEVIELIPMPDTHPNAETWSIKISCAGPIPEGQDAPSPVSGYLSKTRGIAPGTAKAQVNFDGYGVRSARRRDSDVNDPNNPKIVLDINAHGIENGMPSTFYKEFREQKIGTYGFDAEENSDPKTTYFYGMALRALRALEFIKSQPEWDGETLIVAGGSQGGFQALLAAGLDPDVTHCFASKPWLCDLGGLTLNRRKGWRPNYTPALDYYDPVNHAKRIRAETRITAGLGDYTCPPSGLAVLYNNIPDQTPKTIVYQQGATHKESPPNMVSFTVTNREEN